MRRATHHAHRSALRPPVTSSNDGNSSGCTYAGAEVEPSGIVGFWVGAERGERKGGRRRGGSVATKTPIPLFRL